MAETIGLISTLIGIVLSLGSGLLWWSSQKSEAEVKKYAAQREFGHIKNSLAQLSENLANERQDVSRRLDGLAKEISDLKFFISDSRSRNTKENS
ncbi:MAG: hypothetical protein F6K62_25420 [Sphaerospermopsis sp. SIO1G2]|nr:hypothetical protein [Sphaerospermopsis sp. SIO1G2]